MFWVPYGARLARVRAKVQQNFMRVRKTCTEKKEFRNSAYWELNNFFEGALKNSVVSLKKEFPFKLFSRKQ